MSDHKLTHRPHIAWWNDPFYRGLVYQLVLLCVLLVLVYEAASNASQNMRARGIPTDFGFWFKTSGFDINLTLIDYGAASSTYGRAFWVGLLNTLLVAGISIPIATLIGFFIGIARLSANWLMARLAGVYVESLRNIPLLLQLLFWYNAVLKPLPNPRDSLVMPGVQITQPDLSTTIIASLMVLAGGLLLRRSRAMQGAGTLLGNVFGSVLIGLAILFWLFGGALLGLANVGLLHLSGSMGVFLNNRGLILPEINLVGGALELSIASLIGLGAAFVYRAIARERQRQTGKQQAVALIMLAIIIGVPLITFGFLDSHVTIAYAELRGFNFAGGVRVSPEFAALIFGLSTYTASFIAEVVRGGILAVPQGQNEASAALGLRRGLALKLVIIPQAMRVIIPPLTNQYLNLIKNSSLAVFVGFPDLVQVFAGTVLNQTGAAVQVISITMAVYLVVSLFTSLIMDLYNRRMALVDR
jgi:general L-amino acid transport system permease protein